jgi:hypothetical protein
MGQQKVFLLEISDIYSTFWQRFEPADMVRAAVL